MDKKTFKKLEKFLKSKNVKIAGGALGVAFIALISGKVGSKIGRSSVFKSISMSDVGRWLKTGTIDIIKK